MFIAQTIQVYKDTNEPTTPNYQKNFTKYNLKMAP